MQKALHRVIAPKIDPHIAFDHSFAFHRGKSVADAVKAMRRLLADPRKFVLVVDIKSFFPSVDSRRVLQSLLGYLPDTSLSELLSQLLSWEIHDLQSLPEEKSSCFPGVGQQGKGLAQGSLLSPVLANLYLAPFDSRMRDSGLSILRYADDIAIVTENREQAEAALEMSREALRALDLTLPALGERKCRIWDYQREGVEYLGCYLRARGADVHVTPAQDRLRNALRVIEDRCDARRRDPLIRRVQDLSQFVNGWLASYARVADVSNERRQMLEAAQAGLTELLRHRKLLSSDGLTQAQRDFLSLDSIFDDNPSRFRDRTRRSDSGHALQRRRPSH